MFKTEISARKPIDLSIDSMKTAIVDGHAVCTNVLRKIIEFNKVHFTCSRLVSSFRQKRVGYLVWPMFEIIAIAFIAKQHIHRTQSKPIRERDWGVGSNARASQ